MSDSSNNDNNWEDRVFRVAAKIILFIIGIVGLCSILAASWIPGNDQWGDLALGAFVVIFIASWFIPDAN